MELDFPTQIVEVQFWESQRYKPLQGGWTHPFIGGLPSYSDLSGNKAVSSEVLSNNEQCLPKGWRWLDEWKPDTSGVFGETDGDGWSYAGRFETLIKQAQSKGLRSERSTTNIARRRRWIRARICIDAEMKCAEKQRVDQLETIVTRSQLALKHFQRIEAQLFSYNAQWLAAVEAVLVNASGTQGDAAERVEYVSLRLTQLKAFLVEIGDTESRYAASLSAISSKWRDPVQSDASKALVAKHRVPSDRADGHSGFFQLVGASFAAIANKRSGLSNLLRQHLPADVDQVLQAAGKLQTDISDGARIRQEIESQLVAVKAQQAKCLAALLVNGDRLSAVSAFATSAIMQIGAWQDPCSSPYLDYYDFIKSTVTATDSWLCVYCLWQAVTACNSMLLAYFAFLRRICSESSALIERTSSLLQSIVKALVHEEFKVYEETMEMLAALGDDIDVILINKGKEPSALVRNVSPAGSKVTVLKPNTSSWSMWPGLLRSCVIKQGRLRYLEINRPDAPTHAQLITLVEENQNNWRTATAIATVDYFLHLLEEEYLQQEDGPNAKVLLSVDIRGAAAEALLIPVLGYENVFEVRFPSPISTVGLHQTESGRHSVSNSIRQSISNGTLESSSMWSTATKLHGLMLLADSSKDVAQWLQMLVMPFAQPCPANDAVDDVIDLTKDARKMASSAC